MSDKTEKMLHDLRGTLVIVKSFLSAVEKVDMPEDVRELRDAAANNVEKIKELLESTQKTS